MLRLTYIYISWLILIKYQLEGWWTGKRNKFFSMKNDRWLHTLLPMFSSREHRTFWRKIDFYSSWFPNRNIHITMINKRKGCLACFNTYIHDCIKNNSTFWHKRKKIMMILLFILCFTVGIFMQSSKRMDNIFENLVLLIE